MLIYLSHKYQGDIENLDRAREILKELQLKDLANCYICPILVFSHLREAVDKDDIMELHFDILQNCEKMIVASDISKGIQKEIDFAKLIKLEVVTLENGEIQPLKE